MESDPLPTLGELLAWGKRRLRSARIDDFAISAEVLLRDVLGLTRAELLTNLQSTANSRQHIKYVKHIRRRASRTPLQYITGSTEFYNVLIRCDRRALIPRPETEILVDIVVDRLQATESPRILDLGTGSGNIAIALARNIEDAAVLGIDISDGAIELARSNADLNDVAGKCRFLCGDIENEAFVGSLGRFSCVVSNPPYVSEDQKASLQPEIVEFEPKIALFSPGDPLSFFKLIITRSSGILLSGGLLAFETGMDQAGEVGNLMERGGYDDIKIGKDFNGIERVVTGICRPPID